MKRVFTTTIIAALGLVLGANWAVAQDDPGDDLDITMTLMPEDGNLPGAVTHELVLPPLPDASRNNDPESRPGESSSEDGRTIATLARDTARDDGRAIGAAAVEAAQDARNDHSHGSPPNLDDLLPGGDVPGDVPGPGDLPGDVPGGVPGPPDGVPGPPGGVPGPP